MTVSASAFAQTADQNKLAPYITYFTDAAELQAVNRSNDHDVTTDRILTLVSKAQSFYLYCNESMIASAVYVNEQLVFESSQDAEITDQDLLRCMRLYDRIVNARSTGKKIGFQFVQGAFESVVTE